MIRCPNITKAKDIVGYVPKSPSNGLKRTVDYFISQPGLVNG
jgi:nucleoside-diphosphate-sugar epimerase